jgi:hypothetical protein
MHITHQCAPIKFVRGAENFSLHTAITKRVYCELPHELSISHYYKDQISVLWRVSASLIFEKGVESNDGDIKFYPRMRFYTNWLNCWMHRIDKAEPLGTGC